jgi:hypothetical protein
MQVRMPVCQRFARFGCWVFGVLALLAGHASDARAQLAAPDPAQIINTQDTSFGSDAAYDPVNHVYFVVVAREQDATNLGSVIGVFRDTTGKISPPFVVHSGSRANFARAIYSPDISNGTGGAGGFLVTWSEPFTNATFSVTVTYPSGVVGTVNTLWSEYSGPVDTAYSSVSHLFAAAWETKSQPPQVGMFARIGTSGLPVGAAVPLPNASGSWVIWSSIASVAWNASRDEFGVVFSEGTSAWTLRLARVTPSGTTLDTQTLATLNAMPFGAAVQYNPATGNYVVVWSDSGAGTINAAEVSALGAVIASGVISGGTVASHEGLSLSYNVASGTFLLLGFTQLDGNLPVQALELNRHGAVNSTMISVPGVLNADNFAPRAAARSDAPEWLLSDGEFTSWVQVVRTTTVNGGSDVRLGGCTGPDPFAAMGGGTCVNGGWVPAGTPTGGTPPGNSPPPPAPTSSSGCATPDPFAAMGGGTCVNGGWLPPGMTSTGGSGTAPPGNSPPPTPPPTSSSGCATPDPFAAMGGGTCVNGGWLPPGMTSTGGSGTPPPGNSPPPPTPPPPTSPSGCATPDPFAAMGGGTCVNGGWLPPGMTSPGGSGTPPPGNSPPPPTPPPPTSPSGCATPDPFAAMGGGTCLNGGWLPPGMTSAGGSGTPPPGNSPPPPTPPPTSPSGCATPDPFTAMGGGTCVNGGWLPPGIGAPPAATPPPAPTSSTCQTPDPFVALGGGTCVNGGWFPPGSVMR